MVGGIDPNVRLVCASCAKPDSRYFDVPCAWFVGRAVKIAFEEDGFVENMWVVVTGIRGDELVGYLDNHPVVIEHVKFGDKVVFQRTQIKAVKAAEDEPVVEARYPRKGVNKGKAKWKLLASPVGFYGDRPLNWFVGKDVKVLFKGPLNESMWVAVEAVEGDRLVGALLSRPVVLGTVKSGDRVELERRHVWGVAERNGGS